MKYVPKGLTRFASRSLLKMEKHSPTILVVGGTIGFGVTAFMAARATRNLEPILEQHAKDRANIGYISKDASKPQRREQQMELLEMYYNTGLSLTKLYGPTLVVGTLSAASVLSGHKILQSRHVASVAAYSGLMDQFNSYRDRVAKTLGESAEKDIYDGAHGEWVEDPDHKGEYKMKPKWDKERRIEYCRPWFDDKQHLWTRDPHRNYDQLKGIQAHMNGLLQIRGHVFLNDVLDALRMERVPEGQAMGWLYEKGTGDDYIDFGFMTGNDPQTIAFREHLDPTFQFNFNVDDVEIWNQI